MDRVQVFPRCAIGVDIGATKIRGGLVRYNRSDEAPLVVPTDTVATCAQNGAEAILDRVCGLCESIINQTRRQTSDTAGRIAGIGIGTRGHIEQPSGRVAFDDEALMPGWSGTDLANEVERRLHLPTAALNDVQAHTLGEARWGVGRKAHSMLLIAAGTGLGGGFAIGGKLVAGEYGFASEFGHTVCIQAANIPCSCGCTGHLESVASGSGIAARYAELTGSLTNAQVIAKRAELGDTEAGKVIAIAAEALADALVSWVNMIDPSIVVLAGSVPKAGALWESALRNRYRASLASRPFGAPPLLQPTLGSNAPVIGAAEHLFDRYFAQ